jgi:lantibiotic modifying enzyme
MAALRGAMTDAGLDPDRPHLRPASSGAWMADLCLGPSPRRRARPQRADAAALAARIGAGIARRAIWHGEQCTWVGAANEAGRRARERSITALGPTLYDGTAGLAVLFAELAAAGFGDGARETALGALRHAAARDRADTGPALLSAYTGPLGTVWAAACVAVLLESDEGMTIARAHLRHLARGAFDDRGTDVLTGVAGAALALHAIGELGIPGGADLLARCMDRLKVAARRGPDGAHWEGVDAPARRPGLTGYSHGAAGIAATLGLLGERNADAEALHLAREGVRYEQGHFDEAAGNWADLRERRPGSGVVFSHYWCHGAPGIGLGRASMAATLDCSELRAQACAALDTTAAFVAATAFKPDEPHCLCHGLPGNALTLSRALERWPVAPRPGWKEALTTARDGMAAAYDRRGGAFGRCGGDSGTPGLMLGEGGLAYWFLSASGPARTSLLDLSIRPAGPR